MSVKTVNDQFLKTLDTPSINEVHEFIYSKYVKSGPGFFSSETGSGYRRDFVSVLMSLKNKPITPEELVAKLKDITEKYPLMDFKPLFEQIHKICNPEDKGELSSSINSP